MALELIYKRQEVIKALTTRSSGCLIIGQQRTRSNSACALPEPTAFQPQAGDLYGETGRPPKVGSAPLTKDTSFDMLRQSWISFADETTTHGVGQIGRGNKHVGTRIFFAIIVLTCAVSCIWLTAIQVEQYLSYDVKTTTSTLQLQNLTFPAITFCNENMYRKSIVGGSLIFIQEILMFYTAMDNSAATLNSSTNATPYCFDPSINNSLTSQLNIGYHFFESGLSHVMSLTTLDSYQSVLECSWLNTPLNCSENVFLNHFTDYGWCFTFNPSASIVNSYSPVTSYGFAPGANPTSFFILNSGPKNGLRLILNAHVDDYCFSMDKGAGIRAIVHDPDVLPLFFLENAIVLSPGFDVSVAIQVTQITRETESLGRCKSFVPLVWYPNATVYFKQACYMDCLASYIMTKCGCFPAFGPLDGFAVYTQTHPNSSACFGPTFPCMNTALAMFIGNGSLMATLCAKCVDQCEQRSYSNTLSFEYFPAPTQAATLQQQHNFSDLPTLRSNLLGVSFFVESLQIDTIDETQAMSLTDLMCAVGGLMGLFLGMSIVSIVELLRQLLMCANLTGRCLITKKERRGPRRRDLLKV